MADSELATVTQEGERPAEFSRDVALEVLSNQRRRFVLHHLKRTGGEATVSELADRVAGWENGKPIEALSHQERKRVRNALRQFHLPKMDECGFVEYDPMRGSVRFTRAAAQANFYVDSLTGGDIPWSVYYLGLSTLSTVCLVGLVLELYPFSLVSPLTCGVFFVSAMLASAIGHVYDNYYRMRLGAQPTPPEVDQR